LLNTSYTEKRAFENSVRS